MASRRVAVRLRHHGACRPPPSAAHTELGLTVTLQLGARLAEGSSGEPEALQPRRAPKAVSLPPLADADQAPAPSEAPASKPSGKPSRSGAGGGRVYARRPAVCHVPTCGQPLEAASHAYCFRCASPLPRLRARHMRATIPRFLDSPAPHCRPHLRDALPRRGGHHQWRGQPVLPGARCTGFALTWALCACGG